MATMSQKDRAELRRILRIRKDLLAQQLRQRAEEVKSQIREKIESEYERESEKAQKEVDDFLKQVGEVIEQAKQLDKSLGKRGLTARQGRRGYQYPLADAIYRNVDGRFTVGPDDLEEKVQKEFDKIAKAHGYANLDLNYEFLTFEERLAIGAVESDEAKKFLEEIPTVDKLLPAVSVNGKQLKK